MALQSFEEKWPHAGLKGF